MQSLKIGEYQTIKDYPMFKFGGNNDFEARIVRILSRFNQALGRVLGYYTLRKENMSIESRSGGGISGGVGGFSSIVREGPARGFLEGFRPMNASDITTIGKGGTIAPPSVIQQAKTVAAAAWGKNELPTSAQVISQAESILSQAQKPEIDNAPFLSLRVHEVTKQSSTSNGEIAASVVSLLPRNDELVKPTIMPLVVPGIVEFPKPQIITSPALEPAVKAESRISSQPAQTISVQPATEPQEERVVKENPKEVLEEEEIADKRVFLEDGEASAQRKQEIKEAVVKAKAEADRLGLKKITGWLVARFMPAEHIGNRSQVIKKTGPDGSYQETVEVIAAVGEFESEEKAIEQSDEIVAEKKPVKYGKAGTPVANQDVARVFKYRFFKPAQPHLEVVKRVVKKKVQQPIPGAVPVLPQAEKPQVESNITDFPVLAEVFQKAA